MLTMIKTYRLYHDGLPVQSWSISYYDAAIRQLNRETLAGVWELELVSLNPKTLQESMYNVARRVIEPDLVKDTTEYMITRDGVEQPTYPNIYDARKAWHNAITQPGYWLVFRCRNGIPETLLSTANISMGEDWL